MNGEKGMSLLGVAIIVTCFFAIVALFLYYRKSSMTFNVEIRDIVSIVTMLVLLGTLWVSIAQNHRTEKLFVGLNEPLIDVTPIGIVQSQNKEGVRFTSTVLRVVNSSGFDAYEIGIDLRYGNVWIGEWMKADNSRNVQVPILDAPYWSLPKVSIKKLSAWKKEESKQEGITTGQFCLKDSVLSVGAKGYPVEIRVTWQNEHGRIFDEVHRYLLVGTEAKGKEPFGYSFAFIPQGIVYKKNLINNSFDSRYDK